MRSNFIYLFSINLVVLGFSFLLYKIIPTLYGQQYFLEFSFLKRYQTFILPIALAGVAVTLPRLASTKINSASKYLLYSIATVLISASAVFVLFWCLQDVLVQNESLHLNIVEYLIFLTLPLIIPGLLFSYYRGVGQIRAGGVSLIWYGVILPIIGLLSSSDFYTYCRNTCIYALICSAAQLYFIFKARPVDITSVNLNGLRIFIRDSVSRLPGDVGIQLILILPVFFAARRAGFDTTGSLAFVMTLLGMAAFPFKPLSTLLLTEVAQNPGAKRILSIYVKAKRYSSVLGVLGSVIFFLSSPILLQFFGASLSRTGAFIFSICMFYYIRYISIRSFVDGLGARSETSRIILISLCSYLIVQGILYFILVPVEIFALLPFCISLCVLDFLLNRSVKKFINTND